MITKKVTRYYCEHCKKAGGAAYYMQRHEEHCTLNPNRKCRACLLLDGGGTYGRMAEIALILPAENPFKLPYSEQSGKKEHVFLKELEQILPALREATDNCPACIMAILRQSKIPVPAVAGFDFKKEMAAIFSEQEQDDREVYY